MRGVLTAAIAALGVAPLAAGHTWIEQLRNINDQGQYVGEYGYPRGMVSKTDPGFDGFSMNWLLPETTSGSPYINESTPLCHPSQRQQKQSQEKYPRLQAVPGKFIAMRYMENGHVSLPDNQQGKPEKGGTVFVYGTTQPKEDENLVDVLRWTQDGQGGDKRGVLLNMNDYDDGRCYEKNDSPISLARQKSDPNFAMGQVSDGPGNYPLFCESNAAVPKDTQTGKPYTIYWVWQWNTSPGVDPGLPDGIDQYYTTCIDVDVVDTVANAQAEADFALGPQQDAMSIAVSDFASRTALMTDVVEGEVGPVFNATPTATGAPSGTAAPPPAQTTLARAPSGNSSATPNIPTLTDPGDDSVVTVTDTVVVTVTAPAVASQVTPRAAHMARHGVKFRGRFIRD
ncbi:hypothetical protein BU26DRAFT_532018 [Trematosphaeria pertusa]|uniref:DUF7492 domain-containing protein n=1 Tax=Trematosphaeria pertusa TaxID=390896 RepID=A0A6A6IAC7_9PLEO|nr:uncharacterized protein BU26DRAFT_532018 [Trematosphaeria pertusa]KAF2247346.1 hypothetical protein BU26DRAFT_532018 [Trematosphaeria pertusa]